MDIPDFLRFKPVALRAQRNGWAPALQFRFVLALARGASVAEAARALGKTRQSAYDLRKRGGGESFARAWDAALDFRRDLAAAGHSAAVTRSGIETLLVPQYYRRRLVGFVQREDHAGAVRTLNRLDRLAARLGDDAQLRALSETFMEPEPRGPARIDRIDAMRPANASPSSIPAARVGGA